MFALIQFTGLVFGSALWAGEISGIVISGPTGVPLANVQVTARGDLQSREVVTKEDGSFSFTELARDAYTVLATSQGYRTFEDGQRFYVENDQKLYGLRLGMWPSSEITGRVLDADGDPLPGAELRLYAQRHRYAQAVQVFQKTKATDQDGTFRIDDLTPGIYTIGALHRDVSSVVAFHPSPLRINWGSNISGVNISLPRVQTYQVSGTVTDGETGQPCNCEIRLAPAAHLKDDTLVSRKNSFIFKGVPAGAYRIFAQNLDTPDRAGTIDFQVTNKDVDGLVIRVAAGGSLSGQVSLQDCPSDLRLDGIAIELALEGTEAWPVQEAEVSVENASFRFDQVTPGRHHMELKGLPESTYLKMIRLAGQDLPQPELQMPEAGSLSGLEVVLACDGGTLSGRLRRLAPKTTILLIPNQQQTGYPVERVANSDEEGRFQLLGIAPGSYMLFALGIDRAADLLDPEVRTDLTAYGHFVQISSKGKVSIEVELVPPLY